MLQKLTAVVVVQTKAYNEPKKILSIFDVFLINKTALGIDFLFERLLAPHLIKAPVAQLDRALDFESRGQGFESSRARHSFLIFYLPWLNHRQKQIWDLFPREV